MLFKVLTGGSYNAGKGGNPRAREMQTVSERKRMLANIPDNIMIGDEDDVYRYVMSLPEGPAKRLAVSELATEREAMPYWYGDEVPRDPTLKSTSSWVHDIQYNPRTKILSMDGYSVGGVEPEVAAAVLNGEYSTGNGSVGRSLINLWRLKGWGANSGLPPLK